VKRLRPKPFRGVSILDDATAIGIVSINSKLEIASGEIPSRTAAFLVGITSQVLLNHANEAAEVVDAEVRRKTAEFPVSRLDNRRYNLIEDSIRKAAIAKLRVQHPHLLMGNGFSKVIYINLVLATREGWWQIVPADPYFWIRVSPPRAASMLNYDRGDGSYQFWSPLLVKRGPTSFDLGLIDRRMILKAIESFLKRQQ